MKRSILLVGNFLSAVGGSRGVCEELAIRLSAVGWRVKATSYKRARAIRLCNMVANAISWRHEYAVAQVDVFSGPAFLWAEVVCSVLRWLKKPYVLALHGGNLPAFSERWPRRVRCLLRSAAVVTAPSGYLRYGMAPYRADIVEVPNAIDLSRYPFRQRLSAEKKLVWLRSFHEIYNPTMAVEVMKELVRKYPATHLSMVGPDKGDGSFQRTRAAVAVAGLVGKVSFPGQVAKESVPDQLSVADVFINTTNVDNTPVSVIEAMACGLCVVSTRVGGTTFLVKDEQNGVVVDPGDAQAMAAAVSRLFEDKQFARRCSRAARETVEPMDWSSVLPRWENLLTDVAELGEKR